MLFGGCVKLALSCVMGSRQEQFLLYVERLSTITSCYFNKIYFIYLLTYLFTRAVYISTDVLIYTCRLYIYWRTYLHVPFIYLLTYLFTRAVYISTNVLIYTCRLYIYWHTYLHVPFIYLLTYLFTRAVYISTDVLIYTCHLYIY
jgi:hypothetical protein